MSIKQLFRSFIYSVFCCKNNNLSKLSVGTINTDIEKCEFIYSTSTILKFDNNGIQYFRPSRILDKRNRFRLFIINEICFYLTKIIKHPNGEIISKNVYQDILRKRNYRKLLNIGAVFDTFFEEIVSNKFRNYELVGMPSINQTDLFGEDRHFLQFVRGVIFEIKQNKRLKNGKICNFSANRSCCTYALSKYLGLERLIPYTSISKILLGEKILYGTIMENGGDISPAYISTLERDNYSLNFLKDLSSLEYFDFLCYQLDHRLDNYNVVIKNKLIDSVCAFDNDSDKTFFPWPFFPKKTYAGCSCIIKRGYINRPYIDRQLYEKLLDIDYKLLKSQVRVYLNALQVACLCSRIKIFIRALKRTQKRNVSFVVDDWNKVDKQKYIGGICGLTYFELFLNNTDLLDRIKRLGA